MNNYDVIVIGSGNSGLLSALSLKVDGYNVLLLEANNNVGGLSKSIVKGRFEFNNILHSLFLKNKTTDRFRIDNVFSKCKIEDELRFSPLPELCRIITPNADYTIPFGVDNFINKMKEWFPNSEESLNTFFELAKECREALNYIVTNNSYLDYDHIKEYYNNFMRVSNYSISKVLDAIGMPIDVQEVINALWIYFGSTEIELSFVEYAVFLLNCLEYGIQVPSEGSYSVSMSLANRYLELGGEIRLNSEVEKLLVEDNKINGVRLVDGTIIYANKVVVNSSLHNVYGKLINHESVPRKALRNVNRRELGAKLFTVYLGLNRSAKELKLNNYSYLLYESLDSDIEASKMKQLSSSSQVALVYNNAINGVSPEGTCIICLNTLMFDELYGEAITSDKYHRDTENMAYRLIEYFQKCTGVRIIDYIEEIKIVTPIDNIVDSDLPDGSVFGYKLKGLDNLVPRILNKANENYVDGLYVCGGFDGDLFGYNSSFDSGMDIVNNIKNEKVGE